MSKRSYNDKANTHEEQDAKKIKLSTLPIINSSSSSLLLNLPRDEFSHMLNFLTIGEVIMLSLSCKCMNTFLKEHFQMVHPYVVNSHSEGKYSEWSIGRALKTHRKLVVNGNSLDELNDVFDGIIEKSEPFTKLTKHVELTGIDAYDLTSVVNLFSKPIGQPNDNVKYLTLSKEKEDDKDEDDEEEDEEEEEKKNCEKNRKESPLLMRNLKSIPIGFLVKEFSIDDIDISIRQLYLVLSQFRSLEKLKLCLLEGDQDELNEFSIEVPIFEHLRHIQLETGYGYGRNELKLVYDLVKLAPNLEYLEMTYVEPIGDDFLHFLTQKCPKLKGLSVDVEGDVQDLKVTDKGILKFLKGEPNLEYFSMPYYCCRISGEILSQIGQFKNLRHFIITRDVCMEEEVDQYPDLKFGGGILNKLESVSFGSNFSFANSSKSEKDQFVKSLLEVAPNIKNVGTLSVLEGFEIMDYLDELSPLLTKFPKDYCNTNQLKKEEWLTKSKRLEEIDWNLNLDLSNIEPIPSVKILNISEDIEVNNDLCRVFPSITELFYLFKKDSLFFEILKNANNWPNLKILTPLSKPILQIRPNLYGNIKDEGLLDFIEMSKLKDETLQFVKEWIVLDQVEEESHQSEMIKFLELKK